MSTLESGSHASVLAAAVSGYAVGFVVIFVWTCLLHRREGIPEPRNGALPAALNGGALGGLCVLVLVTAEQL